MNAPLPPNPYDTLNNAPAPHAEIPTLQNTGFAPPPASTQYYADAQPDAGLPDASAPYDGAGFDPAAQPNAYYPADGGFAADGGFVGEFADGGFADGAGDIATETFLPEITPDTPFKRFWRKFGGDSFLISLGVHLVLFILAYLVIKTVISISTKREDEFVTGAGGGKGGERVSMSEHRIKPKNPKSAVKTVPKLTVKGAASVSLPEMPKMTMALESGSVMGAESKGFGGGAGGGIGTGIGPGRGSGRNMVSFFGGRGFNTPGLIGTFYDLKQTAKGQWRGQNNGRYVGEARKFVRDGWRVAYMDTNFFRSRERLVISQFCIPNIPASQAPAAFNIKAKPSNWIAHYRGTVAAPFSGKFRFVGMADDWLIVRWGSRNVLEGGYDETLFPRSKEGNKYGTGKPPPGIGDHYPVFPGVPTMKCGPWLTVSKGSKYPMEVAIGETPGGVFYAFLAFEREGERGKLYLFRMSGGKFTPTGKVAPGIDYSGGGMVWTPEMPRGGGAGAR
ncbi:MAG: hypothetical protein LBT53_01485 [Puniceicoccales bacterium]|jgi:hypothetical protein|nr:hypothetical protein [Puniceicoccales bacterium]